jgi:hypothetical protein
MAQGDFESFSGSQTPEQGDPIDDPELQDAVNGMAFLYGGLRQPAYEKFLALAKAKGYEEPEAREILARINSRRRPAEND